MMTSQSAEAVLFEEPAAERIAPVTSMLAKRRRTSGVRTETADTEDFLTYGSLLVERYDSEVTETQQLFPFKWLPISQALQQATQDIRTSGEPVISLFANSAWHLLIASRTVSLPSVLGGGSFESVQAETLIVLTARLFARRVPIKTSSLRAINAWRAVVPADNEEATSSFLSTAVQLSRTALIVSSKGSH